MLLCFRFKEGLATLGILDAVKQHQTLFRDVFVYDAVPLSASVLEEMFSPKFSDVGSNRRAAESRVMSWRLDFVADAEGRPVQCSILTFYFVFYRLTVIV